MDKDKIDSQTKEIDEILPEPGFVTIGGEKIELPKQTLRLKLEISRKLLKMFKFIDYKTSMDLRSILGHAIENDDAYVMLQEAIALSLGKDIDWFFDNGDIPDMARVLIPFFGTALALKLKKEDLMEALKNISEGAQSDLDGQGTKSLTTKKKR